jgi:uncharacterized protein YaiI (UPF0178 family)
VENLVKSEDIISRRVGDEVVVIKDDGLSVHLLNKTAAFIWENCGETCEPEKIASLLCERYEITHDEARHDVEDTIRKFQKLGLFKENVRLTL